MRRRIKRRIQWKRILGVLLTINLAVALFQTRITSVRNIEVKGLLPEDESRVKHLLETLRGIPFLKVSEPAIETEVLRESAIRSAHLTHNIWGGAQLSVVYRTPVARLGDSDLGLDQEGVIFQRPNIGKDLPAIRIADNGPATLVTVAGDWDASRLANLAVRVRAIPEADGVSIDVDERGEVCLNMNSGHVVLGSCDDLDQKLDVLQKRLIAKPSELSQVERLILTKPDAPAIVPLKQNSSRSRSTG